MGGRGIWDIVRFTRLAPGSAPKLGRRNINKKGIKKTQTYHQQNKEARSTGTHILWFILYPVCGLPIDSKILLYFLKPNYQPRLPNAHPFTPRRDSEHLIKIPVYNPQPRLNPPATFLLLLEPDVLLSKDREDEESVLDFSSGTRQQLDEVLLRAREGECFVGFHQHVEG